MQIWKVKGEPGNQGWKKQRITVGNIFSHRDFRGQPKSPMECLLHAMRQSYDQRFIVFNDEEEIEFANRGRALFCPSHVPDFRTGYINMLLLWITATQLGFSNIQYFPTWVGVNNPEKPNEQIQRLAIQIGPRKRQQ